jgi:pilus assembly protein CpaF
MKLSDRLAAVQQEQAAQPRSVMPVPTPIETPAAQHVEQPSDPSAGRIVARSSPASAPDDGRGEDEAMVFDWVTISSADTRPTRHRAAPGGDTGSPLQAPEPVDSDGDVDPLGPELPQEATRPGERVRYVDPLAAMKRTVHQSLLDALGPTLYDAELDERELAARVRQTLQQVLESEQTLLTTAERLRITNEVSDEILGHGPLEPFLRDRDITEIMVNGADQIYVERDGRIRPVNAAFTDDNHLRRTIEKIVGRVGRRIDESSPMVDARLADGSRVNAVLPPVALDGPMLTIRKFAADPLTMHDLVEFGSLTASTANLLAACVRGRLNVLISGGTGSGKTTTLNVLSSFVSSDERIVTIEDAAELQLRQEHVVRMESRPPNVEGRGEITTRDLVRNALRMRPDRIIVGEVRDGAAVDMMQAMNTGHDGSLTTLHANSPRDALARLETMVLMAGVDLPQRAIREQAASAIDLIVHQSRLRDGTRRVTHITEVTGMESDVVTLQDLFLFDHAAGLDEDGYFLGSLRPTGVRPMFLERLADAGISLPAGLFRDRA